MPLKKCVGSAYINKAKYSSYKLMKKKIRIQKNVSIDPVL